MSEAPAPRFRRVTATRGSAAPPLPAPSPLPTPPSSGRTLFETEEEAHFWDYWGVLVRHRWTVITFLLVSVIVTTIWTFTTRPVFTAAATLRIEKDEPRVLKFEEVVKADAQQDYYQTQFKVLQSRTLANRVIGLLETRPARGVPAGRAGGVAGSRRPRPGPGSASCSGCRCRRRRSRRGEERISRSSRR